jgi:alpha-amylase
MSLRRLPLCGVLLAVLLPVVTATLADAQGPPRRPSGRLEPVVQWDHEWLRGAVFYEVFVRSFADSDGDGIGDLRGLIGKLDYLNDGDPETTTDLGVTGIWLMPVFASPSYHGYDVTDYETVNPDYGTNDDLLQLLDEAHARGMRVILDFVLNHTSSEHPWFLDAASSRAAEHRDWYVWSERDPGWVQPWGGSYPTWHLNPTDGAYYYGIFWGGMPDLNYRTPAVQSEVERLTRLWLGRGVDGFRLDAVRYLIETGPDQVGQQDTAETHAYWKQFSTLVRAVRPDAAVVGEVWADSGVIATYYGSTDAVAGGDELAMTFDFPLASAVLDGVARGDAVGVASALERVASLYPAGVVDAPFLTNHDQVRVATRLANDAGALRSAAALLLTLPGTPFVYYGEEIGLRNGTGSGDEAKRTPMPWDASNGGGFTTGTPWYPFAPGQATTNVAAQLADPRSLLAHYRGLIAARSASPALGAGDLQVLTPVTGVAPVLAFARELGAERVLVAVNLSGSSQSAGPYAVAGRPVELLFADGIPSQPSGGSGAWRLNLAANATVIWRFE